VDEIPQGELAMVKELKELGYGFTEDDVRRSEG
jgi:hypothetical protein